MWRRGLILCTSRKWKNKQGEREKSGTGANREKQGFNDSRKLGKRSVSWYIPRVINRGVRRGGTIDPDKAIIQTFTCLLGEDALKKDGER